jgi:hypothetical protein
VSTAAYVDDDPGCSTPISIDAVTSRYAVSFASAAISICTGHDPICAAFTCGVTAAPGHDSPAPVPPSPPMVLRPYLATHTVSPVGAPCASSSICPSADAAINAGRTPPIGALAIPAPLPLNVAPTDPWRVD